MRLIDADALYKEIEQYKAQAEEAAKNADSMSCRMIATTQLVERDKFATLVCWMRTINPFQWVPVEDHLPKKNGKYLVAIKNGNGFSVSTRKFKTQTSHWTIGHWERRTAGVRFWAELPQPPKGD